MPAHQLRSQEHRYVLVERLGRGGVAETWRARRVGGLIEDEVCIKRPLRSLGPEQRRALLEEARLLARVRHSNVVSLIDVIFDRDDPCLVLELVRGIDLHTLSAALSSRAQLLAASVVAAIGLALCRALGAAGRAVPGGVVHRDVTPHNVLVSIEGEIKLADFGIARAFDRERWTAPGMIKGKRAFVSPEQIHGRELDVRSDLFAVGVVLHELLVGRRPFGGLAGAGALRAIAQGERAPLVAPDAPQALVAVVERLLAHDRADRPSSADLAAQALARHADEQFALQTLRGLVRSIRSPAPATAGFMKRFEKRSPAPLNGCSVGASKSV
jgi:eukaryotic-like serine/threonine-protein kinase